MNGEDAVLSLWSGSVHHRDVTAPREFGISARIAIGSR